MELTNEFEVAVPVERAWAVLTDLERIAPCLPGAQLREVQGDEYRGSVKIKVGPITTSYEGVIRISELDVLAHRAVLKAEGRETRGQGNVASVITATLFPTSAGTKVEVMTDLTITGKVAQFGRGVLADVSAKLLDQFVVNLESMVLVTEDDRTPTSKAVPQGSGDAKAGPTRKRTTKPKAPVDVAPSLGPEQIDELGAPDAGAKGPKDPASEVRQINSVPAEPVDLVDLAGGSIARRVLRPFIVTGIAIAVVVHFARRRHK
jgi:carbon monoxide dehydrogenase subunit G